MCRYEGCGCVKATNMKLLHLILWLGEVCTDNTDTNDDAGRWTKHDCKGSLVDKPNEPNNPHHLNLQNVYHTLDS